MREQGKDGLSAPMQLDEGKMRLHPKVMQVVESRVCSAPREPLGRVKKVWAGMIGLVTTLALWWLGEIDGARAVEALTWVLRIFIGSVAASAIGAERALEDGMTRFFSSLAHAVTTYEPDGAAVNDSGKGEENNDKR